MSAPYYRRSGRWERPTARIIVFICGVILLLAVLVMRLADVQLEHGEMYRKQAQENQVRLIPVAAPRGLMYDRHNTVLVRSRPSFVVAAIPSELTDVTTEFATLAKAIGVPAPRLQQRLFHHRGINYTSFSELQTDEPYGPVILERNLSVANVARVSELLGDLPGIDLEVQPIRDYPMGTFASHLFGYVGAITENEYTRLKSQGYSPNDVLGKDGLEAEYDRYLRGEPGGQRIVVDATGSVVRGAKLPSKAAIPGDALQLTIDWRLQHIAEVAMANELLTLGRQTGRKLSGAIVIEDPWSGAILALVSYPNVDPNKFALGIDSKTFSGYLNDPAQPLFNRAIDAATPTGSTFKLVTGTAAISEGVIDPNKPLYDNGSWNCFGAQFRDLVSGGLGETTFVPALAASEDGYFYQLATRLRNARLRKWALLFGLGKRTGIDLPGEYAGNWPTNAWMMKHAGLPLEPADVCSLAIGQGAMQATPLQMAQVVSVVVNGGTLYRPRVVREILSPKNHIIKRFTPTIIRHVPGTPEAFSAVRAGMAQVTSAIGTAYGLAIPGLPFGGKTGTAETAGGSGPNTTWFVAFAPVKHPKLAMAIYVERSGSYGASVAGPIARNILMQYFRVSTPAQK